MKRQKKNEVKGQQIKDMLEKLFKERLIWNGQKEILERLERDGLTTSQSSLSRYLKEIGAEQTDKNQWILGKESLFEHNLTIISDMISKGIDDSDEFMVESIKIALLTVKPFQNRPLAQKIEDTFNEVLYTFCPDDRRILVYYSDSGNHRFVESLRKCVEKAADG